MLRKLKMGLRKAQERGNFDRRQPHILSPASSRFQRHTRCQGREIKLFVSLVSDGKHHENSRSTRSSRGFTSINFLFATTFGYYLHHELAARRYYNIKWFNGVQSSDLVRSRYFESYPAEPIAFNTCKNNC
jgi:hypothetical protein